MDQRRRCHYGRVGLVFDITSKSPGIVGRIAATDGECLLIESAETLPDWVTPEDSDRRVFVLDGKLHIASPAAANRRGKEGELYDEDALLQVLDPTVKTEASAAVQRLIQHKLDEVPTYETDGGTPGSSWTPVQAHLYK